MTQQQHETFLTSHLDEFIKYVLEKFEQTTTDNPTITTTQLFWAIYNNIVEEFTLFFDNNDDDDQEDDHMDWSENEILDIVEQTLYVFLASKPTPLITAPTLPQTCVLLNDLQHNSKHNIAHVDRTYKRYNNAPRRMSKTAVKQKLEQLAAIPQPKQRTPEWYLFRYNCLTASNAYKALGSQAAKNSLIYDKCKPLAMDGDSACSPFNSIGSACHHGQKYEPLSTMLYQLLNNTTIQEFGCITHPTLSCLAASPDGINNDPTNPTLYGRMLEIKNVVSRKITGIPKDEYEVQMQLQMEVCGLDECDFLETKFIELDNMTLFKEDIGVSLKNHHYTMKTLQGATIPQFYGIIVHFRDPTNSDIQIYKYHIIDCVERYLPHSQISDPTPLSNRMIKDVLKDVENECITAQKTLVENHHNLQFINILYWKLDVYSCVLVHRDRMWFESNAHHFKHIWEIIERERISGYEHRAPVRRNQGPTTATTPTNCPTNNKNYFNECLFDDPQAQTEELRTIDIEPTQENAMYDLTMSYLGPNALAHVPPTHNTHTYAMEYDDEPPQQSYKYKYKKSNRGQQQQQYNADQCLFSEIVKLPA